MRKKCITFNEESKVFVLRTAHSVYQMQVREFGALVHLYYGADVGDTEITHRTVLLDRGFCGNPYEAGDDRTFSLDVLLQEYSGCGNGDYRINGLEVQHEDGSNIVHLCYESHRMIKGKYSLDGMPAMYGSEDEAETLEIVLRDRASNLKVTLLYGVFPNLDIITRAVCVRNEGKQTVTVRRAMSMEIGYPDAEMDMIHFYGKHSMERMTERQPLSHGVYSVESKRGMSSHQHNPFVILCGKSASESEGDCYGFALAYSGSFCCEAEVDQTEQIRIVMGIHPYHFAFRLEQGEQFQTPETVMAYSDKGLERLSHLFHDAYRSNLIRSSYVDRPRPLLVNSWETVYFDFDEKKLLGLAEAAKEIGLDMFVLDDGWFGKRDSDCSGLGDWIVNEEKIKGGLQELVKKIHGMGLRFGLWIEPEMVSEDSGLYREHPDWCLRVPGRHMVRSRQQLNLDITRKEVRDHVMEQIFRVLDCCKADYIKWDMNRSVANVFSAALPKERQGEVLHRYVLGVYEMMERLIQRYPDILLETCAGGGGRFDAGMLYYSPQIWCSDNTDAIDRLKIQYGTSFGYPASTMGAHVSVCPNHQTGRSTPFDTRGVVASAGTFGYELDLGKITSEEKELAKRQIRKYKEMERLVQTGDYYRLSDPFENHDYVVWQFVSKDRRTTIVNGVMIRNQVNPSIRIIRLRGLDAAEHYRDKNSGNIYTGAALMRAGIPLPVGVGDYQPIEIGFVMEKGE